MPGSVQRSVKPAGTDKKVLLASPRGWCAGVERAVEIVERSLHRYGPPVYVRKQIVHNLHVVRGLEAKGAVFVESEDDVPEGAVCVLSAHGVSPAVHVRWSPRSTSRPGASPQAARPSFSSVTPTTRRSREPTGRRPPRPS